MCITLLNYHNCSLKKHQNPQSAFTRHTAVCALPTRFLDLRLYVVILYIHHIVHIISNAICALTFSVPRQTWLYIYAHSPQQDAFGPNIRIYMHVAHAAISHLARAHYNNALWPPRARITPLHLFCAKALYIRGISHTIRRINMNTVVSHADTTYI